MLKTAVELHETEDLLHGKNHHHLDKAAAYSLEKGFYQLHIQKRANIKNM